MVWEPRPSKIEFGGNPILGNFYTRDDLLMDRSRIKLTPAEIAHQQRLTAYHLGKGFRLLRNR